MAQHSNGNDNGFEKLDSDELLVSSSDARKGKSDGSKHTVTGGKQTESYHLDPRVVNLIYWRDIRKTAIVFTAMIFLLLSIAFYSIISVAAYLSLAILAVTLSFVTKSRVLAFVQKTPVTHPFRQYFDKDVTIPRERVHQFIDSLTGHAVIITKEVRRLYLVEDVPSSLKLALFFWAMTYIGDWFNGMSLVVLGFVGVFTLPKFYEAYRVQIDNYIDIVKIQVKQIVHKIQTKLPAKKKAE